MGFRDYRPGINRFLSRDTHTGALADLNLATSPWTGNRYTLAGGNPITGIETDGHGYCDLHACPGDPGYSYPTLPAPSSGGTTYGTPAPTATGTPPPPAPAGDYLSLGVTRVTSQLTLQDIFNNPQILRGMAPHTVYSAVRDSLPGGYVFERPGKGENEGIGLVIRQWRTTKSGKVVPGSALIKWQPGGSPAHPDPYYWNVSTPEGVKTTNIPGAASKTWSKPGTVAGITAPQPLRLLPGIAAGALLAESYQVGRHVDACGWSCAGHYLFGPELWAELYLPEGCVDPQCMA